MQITKAKYSKIVRDTQGIPIVLMHTHPIQAIPPQASKCIIDIITQFGLQPIDTYQVG